MWYLKAYTNLVSRTHFDILTGFLSIPKDHWTLTTGYFEDPTPAIQVQNLSLEGPRSLGMCLFWGGYPSHRSSKLVWTMWQLLFFCGSWPTRDWSSWENKHRHGLTEESQTRNIYQHQAILFWPYLQYVIFYVNSQKPMVFRLCLFIQKLK